MIQISRFFLQTERFLSYTAKLFMTSVNTNVF